MFFYRTTREAFETWSTGKIVLIELKLLNITENLSLLVCPGYNLLVNWFQIAQSCKEMKTNWTSTVITLHSVSGVWLQFHVICSKYYKFYYPTFLLLKICFPYTYYEDIKPFKVKGGSPCSLLGHMISAKGLGRVPGPRRVIMIEHQKRPLLCILRWPMTGEKQRHVRS